MKILMVLELEFPPDDRVEKEAVSLIGAGHEVMLLCYTRKNKPLYEEYKKIKVFRVPISKLMYKTSAACLILPYYFKFWKKNIEKIYSKEKFNAIHIHDLPLSKVGYYFKKKYNIKLVCDQHEYYSDWIVNTVHYNKGLGKIVNKLSNWKAYEKYYLKKADIVITIEPPLKESYINDVGINKNKIILVPNTQRSEIFNHSNIDPEIQKKYSDSFNIFYAGSIEKIRGIDIIVRSLPLLQKEIPNIKFVLGGKIHKDGSPFPLAEKLGVHKLIDFVGWIPIEKLPSYINACQVCLHVPPILKECTNKTVATKIYQYIIMGKPIIVSQGKMMKKLVMENNIGFSIKNDDHEDLAQKILEIYKDNELAKKFSYNCIQIAPKYKWENTIKPLLDVYKKK